MTQCMFYAPEQVNTMFARELPLVTQQGREGLSMAYDIKEFYSDMPEKSDWVTGQEKLDWLIGEVARLQEENERLLEENRALREEVTLARLTREAGIMPVEERIDPTLHLPEEARRFLGILPPSFVFGEYFQRAGEAGIDSTVAKDYLRLFLREKLLLQKGQRIEKTAVLPVRSGR